MKQKNLKQLIPIARPGEFLSNLAMNPADQKVIAAAVTGPPPNTLVNNVALSKDRGNTFTYQVVPSANPISALTFSSSGSLLFANTFGGSSVNTVYACTIASAWSCMSIGSPATMHTILNLAVPKNNDSRLFAVGVRDSSNYRDPVVFYYNGATWKDITIEGSQLDTAPLGGAIAYISKGNVNTVAVATSQGIMVPNGNLDNGRHTDWVVIANGFPVVSMMDMVYSAEDDRLVIATLGRGIWYVEKVSQLVWDNVSSGPQYRSLRV